MDMIKNIFKINMKNFNFFTLLSILCLLAGLLLWISWGIKYGEWTDIGIYSITIFLVLPGIIGILLTLHETETD